MKKEEQNLKHLIPLWIMRGGKYGLDQNNHYLSAVGMANSSCSDIDLKASSEDKARRKLIKKIRRFKEMMDQEIDSNSSELIGLTEKDRKRLKIAVPGIICTLLSGVEFQGSWRNPLQPEHFTLARLSLVSFKKSLQKNFHFSGSRRIQLEFIFNESWKKYNENASEDIFY